MDKIGRYEVLQEMGRGPLGAVYKARDPEIGRLVAIKTFSFGATDMPADAALERFRAEAKAAASLHHPHIVTLFEAHTGEVANAADPHGRAEPYLVMDFVEGEGLHHIVAQGGAIPKDQVVKYLHALSAALDYAHSRRIIHGELKPSNVIIDGRGRLYVKNFGLVLMRASLHDDEVTAVSHAYEAPEVIAGGPGSASADLFSLAVVISECLTGVHPFSGEGTERIAECITYEAPIAPSSLNPRLSISVDIVFSHALAKSPDERYPSAREFYEALARALDEPPQPVLATTNMVAVSSSAPQPPLMPPFGSSASSEQFNLYNGPVKEPVPSVPLRTKLALLLLLGGSVYLTYLYREAGNFDRFVDALVPSEEAQAWFFETDFGKSVLAQWVKVDDRYREYRYPPPPTDGRPVALLTNKELLSVMVAAHDNEARVRAALTEARSRKIPLTGMAPYLLNSQFPTVRAEGVVIMATRDDRAASHELVSRLNDADAAVRFLIAQTLAKRLDARIVAEFHDHLPKESEPRIRKLLQESIDTYVPGGVSSAPTPEELPSHIVSE